jgi:acyl carrier protein
MRSEAEIREIVFRAIAETFRFPVQDIDENTTAADVDGWDSVSTAKLYLDLEDILGRELPIETLLASRNVGELASMISAFLHKGEASA